MVAVVGGAFVGLGRMREKDAPKQDVAETAKGETANSAEDKTTEKTEETEETEGEKTEENYVKSESVVTDSVIGPGENSQKLAPKPIVTPSDSSSSGSEETKGETPGKEEQGEENVGSIELPVVPLE